MGGRGSLKGDRACGKVGGWLEAWNKGAGAWGGSLRAWGAGAWRGPRGWGPEGGGLDPLGTSGRTFGRSFGRSDVRTFGRSDGRTDGRKFPPVFYSPKRNKKSNAELQQFNIRQRCVSVMKMMA